MPEHIIEGKPDSPPPKGLPVIVPSRQWGIVELMGHVRVSGLVTEEQKFGTVMGRVDIPQADGTVVTQYFNGSSVYRFTETTEEIARKMAVEDRPMVGKWEALPSPSDPEDDLDEEISAELERLADDDEVF